MELIIPRRIDAWAEKNERINALIRSEYGVLLKAAYSELDTGALYMSHIHGIGHIERTMLLGAMIAQAQGLCAHETQMLLLCCSYHDVGRHNDRLDDEHGAASASLIEKRRLRGKFAAFGCDDFTVMRSAIASHSLPDRRMAETAARYGVADAQRDRFFRIARALKDADNLDRVRLGDLDVSHLRHPESIVMASDAQWIFDEYRE